MIDAALRVHVGDDIYGPWLAQPGGPFAGKNKTSGANRICILVLKKGDHKWLKYAVYWKQNNLWDQKSCEIYPSGKGRKMSSLKE